jgi:O-antigen ligase
MIKDDLEAKSGPEYLRRIEALNLPESSISISGNCLLLLARLLFAGLIITIPFRTRAVLFPVPVPPIYRDYTDVLFFASDLFLLGLLAVWIASLVIDRRRPRFDPLFLTVPLLALPAIGLLSAVTSVAASISLYNTVRIILLLGLYLYVLNEIHDLRTLAWPFGVQVFVQSVVAIGQVLRQGSAGLRFLGELDLNPAVGGISVIWNEGTRLLRAYGLSDHPNILGGSLALGLLVLLIVYPSQASSRRPVFASLFILGSLGMFLTFSRSAWLAFAFGVGLLVFFQAKNRLQEPLTQQAALLLASVILLAPFVWHYAPFLGMRFNYQASFDNNPQEQQAIGERALLIQSANEILVQHPLTGVGLAAFPIALRQAKPQFPVDYQPAHFVLLDVAVETGILGGLVYFLLMILPWFTMWVNRRRITPTSWLYGASSLLLAVTVIGFFDYYTWLLAPGRLWQWIIWGLWGAAYSGSLSGGET